MRAKQIYEVFNYLDVLRCIKKHQFFDKNCHFYQLYYLSAFLLMTKVIEFELSQLI